MTVPAPEPNAFTLHSIYTVPGVTMVSSLTNRSADNSVAVEMRLLHIEYHSEGGAVKEHSHPGSRPPVAGQPPEIVESFVVLEGRNAFLHTRDAKGGVLPPVQLTAGMAFNSYADQVHSLKVEEGGFLAVMVMVVHRNGVPLGVTEYITPETDPQRRLPLDSQPAAGEA